MTRIDVRDDPDGSRTMTIECEDMVPGVEIEPWLVAYGALVRSSARPEPVTAPAWDEDTRRNVSAFVAYELQLHPDIKVQPIVEAVRAAIAGETHPSVERLRT